MSKKNTIFLRDTAGSPERARQGYLARSGNQSQCGIRCIFSAHGTSHLIKLLTSTPFPSHAAEKFFHFFSLRVLRIKRTRQEQAWSKKELLYGKITIFLRDTVGSPERARQLHLARSGSLSQRAIWFIFALSRSQPCDKINFYIAHANLVSP